jgi:hypothetical protein
VDIPGTHEEEEYKKSYTKLITLLGKLHYPLLNKLVQPAVDLYTKTTRIWIDLREITRENDFSAVDCAKIDPGKLEKILEMISNMGHDLFLLQYGSVFFASPTQIHESGIESSSVSEARHQLQELDDFVRESDSRISRISNSLDYFIEAVDLCLYITRENDPKTIKETFAKNVEEIELYNRCVHAIELMAEDSKTVYQPESSLVLLRLPSPLHIAVFTGNESNIRIPLESNYKFFVDAKDPIMNLDPEQLSRISKSLGKEVISMLRETKTEIQNLQKKILIRDFEENWNNNGIYGLWFPEYFLG